MYPKLYVNLPKNVNKYTFILFIYFNSLFQEDTKKLEVVKEVKAKPKVQEELRELKENRQVKEIEYRTVEWPKDALYFSYEPNFLFLGTIHHFVKLPPPRVLDPDHFLKRKTRSRMLDPDLHLRIFFKFEHGVWF